MNLIAGLGFVDGIAFTGVSAAIAFARHRAVTRVSQSITGPERRWRRGKGFSTIEGAPDIQLVTVVTLGIEPPVGRPGVQEHDEITVNKSPVALGNIQRVVPGLVTQVDKVVIAGIGITINQRVTIRRRIHVAIGWALMPRQNSRLVTFTLYDTLQYRVGIADAVG